MGRVAERHDNYSYVYLGIGGSTLALAASGWHQRWPWRSSRVPSHDHASRPYPVLPQPLSPYFHLTFAKFSPARSSVSGSQGSGCGKRRWVRGLRYLYSPAVGLRKIIFLHQKALFRPYFMPISRKREAIWGFSGVNNRISV